MSKIDLLGGLTAVKPLYSDDFDSGHFFKNELASYEILMRKLLCSSQFLADTFLHWTLFLGLNGDFYTEKSLLADSIK